MAREPLSYDAVVVGAGIAGFTAAMALKRKRKSVAVLARSTGASSVSSGSWDFGPVPLTVPAEGSSYSQLRASERWNEIYKRPLRDGGELGSAAAVRELAEEMKVSLKELDLSFHFDQAICLPTTGGKWKRTFAAQGIQAKARLDELRGHKIGLVSGESWRFRADLLASKLSQEAEVLGPKLDISPLWIDFNPPGPDWPLPLLAARLAHDEHLRGNFRRSLERRLNGSQWDYLLFPPLFLDPELAESLSREFRLPVAECLATVEPTPGERLRRAIRKGLEANSIPYLPVGRVEATPTEKKVTTLRAETGGSWTEIRAKSFVLATGKFLGGGVHLGYHFLAETVFGLPLYHNRTDGIMRQRTQLPWGEQSFTEEQAWARLGVWVDEKWRPRDSEGAVLTNVHACGSLLGGVDFARDKLGLGFLALTGKECAHAIG